MKKIVKYTSILSVLILIIGFIGINNIAPYAILQPPRVNENITPQQLGLSSDTLDVLANDGINLSGYWIKTKRDTAKGIMILIHGIGGCKEHFLGLSKELAKNGIESIVFDGRAHGKSGGEFCTYGFKEKKDISSIVDKIKAKNPHLSIGIWGNSLGGAIAIQALEIDKRIEFGVIESTFGDLHQIVFDYKKRVLNGFGIKWLSDFALEKAGEIGDFNPHEVKPMESVKYIEQPMFIAHGDADQSISYQYGQQLFENLKTKDKEFVLVQDAGHFGLFDKGGLEYKEKILSFIEKNLSN